MSQGLSQLPLQQPWQSWDPDGSTGCTRPALGQAGENHCTALGAALRLMGGVIYGDMFVMGP